MWDKHLCPAYGKTCSQCGRENHFAAKCRANISKTKQPHQHVHAVHKDGHDEHEYVLKINDKAEDKAIMAHMKIEDNIIRFQVDPGATVNILPLELVPNIPIQPCSMKLRMWNDTTHTPVGKCRTMITNCKNDKQYSVEFVVVKQMYTPILGKRASEQMGLIHVNYENISAVNNDNRNCDHVFKNELGKLSEPVHLTIDKSIMPRAVMSSRVPISMKKKLAAKLSDLEQSSVIQKVDKPTEWVSRMAIGEKKPGDIRICIDPQILNLALKRELHPLPIMDDILPELSNAKVFSKFDLRNGYWHCVLDEESSYLTTFQTPWGRYRWLRLPFGLAVSSEIFQKRLIVALEGLDGVVCVADDILVYGVGDNEQQATLDHDEKLRKLMTRCSERGIRLNNEKTEMRKNEIRFLGHRISKDGLKPDPDKVKAIVNMKPPSDVTEIQRLAGMVNYLAKFLRGLSDAMKPIRYLTNKDVEWEWGKEQDDAFNKVKTLVAEATVLSYYDQEKSLVIQCDASKAGLGTVLMQDGKPIAYASRALTPTECRYAQLEKEMLAITFSLTKFHQYTFGRHTHIISDHKPLQAIVKKPLDQAPRRLQGMLLKAQKYDITIEYRPGKEMHIADHLSRSHLKTTDGGEEFETINMVSHLPIRREKIDKIRQATKEDEVMSVPIETILCGWPETKADLPIKLTPYFHTRDEYTVQDGLVFKGDRVVIPVSLRKEMKEAIHSSHIGIEGCLRRARECIYWPGMNAEIKEHISTCAVCNAYPASQQKETLMTHDLPDRPWEKVGVDIMQLQGRDYLVTVDYYSNFWEVDHLTTTKSNTVIKKLKAHFSRYGSPSVLISDNAAQFVCEELSKFTQSWDIEHRTSSPTHAKSNGMAESAVKSVKNLLRRAAESKRDPYLAMLDYRNTPTQDADASPAQRNLGRRARTLLPMTSSLLKPSQIDTAFAKRRQRLKKSRSSWYYDKGAKDLNPLHEGDTVRIKPCILGQKTWKRGTVNKRLDERSYEVETESGVLRRNRVYLNRTNEAREQNDSVIEREEITTENPRDGQIEQSSEKGESATHPEQEEEATTRRSERTSRGKLPMRYKDFHL